MARALDLDNKSIQVSYNKTPTEFVFSFKLLRMLIDKHFDWTDHVNNKTLKEYFTTLNNLKKKCNDFRHFM